jgi:sulfide:quinone oxidoreductase
MKHVAVLGGGIGGVEAAIALRQEKYAVSLISARDFLFVSPLAIWVPTGGKSVADISIPLAEIAQAHGFDVIVDEVSRIDPAGRRVLYADGRWSGAFDALVIATGAAKMRPPGVENTLSICGSPADVTAIHERVEALMRQGGGRIAIGFGGNPADTSAVRGGPVFELAFNINHLLAERGLRDRFAITFFAPMESPGARLGEKAVRAIGEMFGQIGIATKFGTKIAEFTAGGVRFVDGTELAADLTLFTPGLAGQPLLAESGLPVNAAGFVKITQECQVQGQEVIYAIGDAAAIEGPAWVAKQGHVAEMMARTAAFNLANRDRGTVERKHYGTHLHILCMMDTGNGAALVYRDDERQVMAPLPVIGHWMKRGWGHYYRLSKLGRIPRLPGA